MKKRLIVRRKGNWGLLHDSHYFQKVKIFIFVLVLKIHIKVLTFPKIYFPVVD